MCGQNKECVMLMIWCVLISTVISSCPCDNPDWCKPITNTTRKEIFMFSVVRNSTTWKKFDWTRTTTVCGAIGIDLMCDAHKNNVRVTELVGVSASDLTNSTTRTEWVQQQLKMVQSNHLDGINIDFEKAIPKSATALIHGLNQLVNETVWTFKQAMPYSQITMDVPYSPDCIYDRCYDYKTLASLLDFLVIMDYDEWGSRIAGPNSGYQLTHHGLNRYLSMTSANKLLLAVPWYGYKYKCTNLTKDYKCITHGRASQHQFSDIYELLSQTHSQRMWDDKALSPYFTYNDTRVKATYQVWYDDPESLIYKYNMAAKYNIRGVGVWHSDCVEYDDSPLDNAVRHWMWDALPLRS